MIPRITRCFRTRQPSWPDVAMSGTLQLVPEHKHDSVIAFLKQDLPRTISIYNTVKILSKWSQKYPSTLQLKIYCIDGDPKNEECVFCDMRFMQFSKYYLVYSRKSENPLFVDLLVKQFDIRVDDGKALLFQAINEQNYKLVESLLEAKNIPVSSLNLYINNNFWLPPEKCKNIQIELPDDLYIDFLDGASHAEIVNDSWPHKFRGSLEFIHFTIDSMFGLGLFRKVDKQLVSFGAGTHYGGVGLLYTPEEFRRKGYATIVILAICKELFARGYNPHAYVLKHNKPSTPLFKKLGFEVADSITWYCNI